MGRRNCILLGSGFWRRCSVNLFTCTDVIITFRFPSSHAVPTSVGGFSSGSHKRSIFGVFLVLAELSPTKPDGNSTDYRLLTYLLSLPPSLHHSVQLIACSLLQETKHACMCGFSHFFTLTHVCHFVTPTLFLAGLAAFVNCTGPASNTHSQPCQPETMCLNSSSNSVFNFTSSLHCSFFLVYITDINHEWLLRIFGQVIDF